MTKVLEGWAKNVDIIFYLIDKNRIQGGGDGFESILFR